MEPDRLPAVFAMAVRIDDLGLLAVAELSEQLTQGVSRAMAWFAAVLSSTIAAFCWVA